MGTTGTGFRAAIAAAALMVAHIAGAHAAPVYMPSGDRTTQPIGHYELCRQLPQECSTRSAARRPVELTRALWAEMIDINNAVNVMVAPKTDREIWGKEEVWSYPTDVGDCEDYVLEKRKRLMQLGVPAGNLLITVVRQPNGDGHAVLTVRTSLGDFVLDNLEPKILDWTQTEYTFLKRQSERHSGVWIAIDDSRNVAVGSVAQSR